MREDQTVIGVSPFERPDVSLVLALGRAGALGVVDLGHDFGAARVALASLAKRARHDFGVRVPEHVDVTGLALPECARVVVIPASRGSFSWGDRRVLAQVTSIEEARAAIAGGVHGLIVKGHEGPGVVGDETTFVLLQRVLAEVDLPVWAQGGLGLHSAAACLAAGAKGVVFDTQLALFDEASTSAETRKAVASMDGSETVVANGYRLYARPNARPVNKGATQSQIAAELGADDPAKTLLTLGQDACFAKPFADRFAAIDRFVRGVHVAIAGHVRHARALRPLDRHAPLARAMGTDVPIVQGPMTRVSDRAAFAQAVAQGGALPFLALSLMRADDAGPLLEETKARLGDRPWGVGVLGFLPPDLREEQLALILALRPPFALIAGGRPSQAKPLEDVGIKTFLHVPSPGLLDMFLKDGARRFVFEGRECGGHVGPRSSFVLWEQAIDRLLALESLRDVQVLFAGGIHDARSARAVATLAAPLVARGAQIGVLMGTAYLFTDEAVATGAIGAAFQEEAIACERTALVETAPGHATRCAESDFVRAFEAERARLEREGKDAQEIWAALEQLNLGRLRIAAKGLRRSGGNLVDVDAAEQHREGMFMIGQVASLRRARCSIADLHRDVADRSSETLADIEVPSAPKRDERAGRETVDVAIVGMACIFPDAPDLASYWSNVVHGRNAVREVPRDRWDPALYFDPHGTGDKTPSKWGGFLQPTLFDPSAYGIPPRSLAAIDPTQLLALEVARRALADAGLADKHFDRERASVVFGAEAGTDLANAYGFRATLPQYFAEIPESIDASLPKLTEDSFPGVLANVIAGRIANRLDLRGVNFTVDAACASSLAAVDVGCKELASGSSDLVLAGGADLHNGVNDFLMFASVHALSPTGQSRPFDGKADGIALGEGVAAVVLKRLDDAIADGDRIYAVLRGVGGSSDGKSLGLTAPRREGQLRALERAWDRAGVAPSDVGLVEAHGTGTVVGDRTELATLSEFFGASGATAKGCTLGSVKSLIGHTKCAAGLAGLIKAALAVHHGVLPPTKNVTSPNPAWDLETSPFVFRDVAAPWTSETRVAAISAFGFGGTNFHCVISAHEPSTARSTIEEWSAELFVVRAASRDEAIALLDRVDEIAGSEAPPKLRDLALTVARQHRDSPARLAIVATSLADLRAKIAAARGRRADAGVHEVEPSGGDVAFLFPGQGSQKPGMLAELFVAFPELHSLAALGRAWGSKLFPGTAFGPDQKSAQQRAITDTRVAQPTLGIVDLGVARLLERVGVRAAMLGGHSYGELVALAVGGAFDAETLLALSEARARCILDAAAGAPGTMAAVQASIERVRAILEGEPGVVVANHNAPDQVVIAGPDDAVLRAGDRLAAAGIAARPIPVACAFHSPVVAAASATFAEQLALADIVAPVTPVYANATATTYAADADDVRRTLAAQVASPVRFVEEIEAMYAAGARIFLEVGPGGVLRDLVGRILKGRAHVAISCDRGDGAGVPAFLSALAKLVAAGVTVDVEPLLDGRAKEISLDVATRWTAPATAWWIDGGGARPVRGELPEFAMRPMGEPVAIGAVFAPNDTREEAVRDYLEAMRDLAEAQRDVMLRFLGDEVVATNPRVERRASNGPVARPQAARASSPAPSRTPSVAPSAAPSVSSRAALIEAPKKPLELLVATVSERTGYPPEMLDPDLDVEADLGIDSIKRIEILGEMRDRLGLRADGGEGDAVLEKLASVKTLRGIAELLEARLKGASPAKTVPPPQGPRSSPESMVPAITPSIAPKSQVSRYVPRVESVPPSKQRDSTLAGKRFVVTRDERGVADALATLLALRGASANVVAADTAIGAVDGLVHVATLTANGADAVRDLFARAQEATRGKAAWVLAATGLGGRFGHHEHARSEASFGAGVAGFMKSLAKESNGAHVRAIDLDSREDAAHLADHLLHEILADDAHVEVGWVGGERHTLIADERAASLPPPSPLAIDRDSVVLVTGGARGITAQIALGMAARFGCTLELVGRSPLPSDEEDAELAAATDAMSLRRTLLARMNGAGPTSPAAVEAMVRDHIGAREIRATLNAIRAAGSRVSYRAVDVRDEAAFGALIDELRDKHGRIDGVVHGAGLIEDKLLEDKSAESFERVFSTKVDGARVLATKLAHDARFFVLFSSVSGAFGNRGQTDYAAANDALDKLAHALHGAVRARVLSINWGPWRGVGMVRPELEREYARRGIALIDPEDGIARFFDELLAGSDPQVILTAASAEALG